MEVKSNAPHMSFGWEDMLHEIEPSYTSRFQSFQYCLDQERDHISRDDDTLADHGTIVDDIIGLENLHHVWDVGEMPPCINLEKGIICEDIEYDSKDFVSPSFISKEDVNDDTPPQEIIVVTLHCGIMVISSSQLMTPCYVKWFLIFLWGRMMNLN